MKMSIFLTGLLIIVVTANSQKTFTKTGDVRFSSDGKQFVFSSITYEASSTPGVLAKRVSARLGIMNIDGSNLKFITAETAGVADAGPVISSDGKKILFRRDDLKNNTEPGDIYIINSDGTGLKQLSNRAEHDKNPEFAVDGKGIIFVREYFTGIGKARDGELVYVDMNSGQEKIMLAKEMRVIQAIPLHIKRGGYLLACAETNDDSKPLPAGSMLSMASPDGEISSKSKMIFPEKEKVQIKQVRVVATEQLTFYVNGSEGTGWFAEDVNFKVSAGQIQKLTGREYYSDVTLSSDGKMGALGGDGIASINIWDFSNDQFINKRKVAGK